MKSKILLAALALTSAAAFAQGPCSVRLEGEWQNFYSGNDKIYWQRANMDNEAFNAYYLIEKLAERGSCYIQAGSGRLRDEGRKEKSALFSTSEVYGIYINDVKAAEVYDLSSAIREYKHILESGLIAADGSRSKCEWRKEGDWYNFYVGDDKLDFSKHESDSKDGYYESLFRSYGMCY